MKFVSRAAWGARPSKGTLASVSGVRGTKVHYEGAPVPASLAGDHAACVRHMRDLQASHLANTAENYSDIAYTAVVCPHGYVFEGRGAGKRTGANGNRALNSAHYAVCGMVGTAGITKPTDAMLHGIRDAIEWLRAEGDAGPEILGHQDGFPTSCPGPDLYAWVQRGAPRPGSPSPGPAPVPQPAAPVEVDDMKVLGGELRPGFDPIGNLVIPPSAPAGRGLFVNIGADMGRVRGRVDIFVTGEGWRRLGEFTVDQNTDLAFYPLPPGTRKVNIKRLSGEGIHPDTPAAWNVEVV